jgi:hypothetical protein
MAELLMPPFHPDHAILRDQGPNPTLKQEYLNSTIFINAKGRIFESKDAIESSLLADLDLSRLNQIHDLLWWAGRPLPARPLHRQLMLGRQILITEQLDMHLLRTKSRIFLKPIPLLLLNHDLWTLHISNSKELHRNACGLLLSYVWLVRYQSDLQIAKKAGWLPEAIMMEAWHQFITSFLEHVDPNTLEKVNKRFTYGELRLNRINQIYRFAPKFRLQHLVFGYDLYPATYGSFFKRNFGWLLGVFAYTSTLLAAMQVGLAAVSIPMERTDSVFIMAAYEISIVFMIAPVIICFITVLLYMALFLFHLISTLRLGKEQKMVIEKAKTNTTP